MPLLDHCDDVVILMVTFLAFIMIVAREFDFDFDAEVEFVHPVSPGGSVKSLPAV